MAAKKTVRCVTTLRRKLGVLRWLWRGFGSLTARPFRLGVPGFGSGVTSPPGLPLGRLPATNLPLTLGSLAITLVPATRLILATAALTQTNPYPRSSRSGTTRTRSGTTGVSRVILGRVHGSGTSGRIVRGERVTVLPGRLTKQETDRHSPVYPATVVTRQKKPVFKNANGKGKENRRKKKTRTKLEEKETKKRLF